MTDPVIVDSIPEVSAVDLIRKDGLDFEAISNIRRIVFDDSAQHEQLEAFAREQPEGSLLAGLCAFVLGEFSRAIEPLRAHQSEPGVRALLAMALTASGSSGEALELVANPANVDEARARVQALSRRFASDDAARDKLREIIAAPGLLEGNDWMPFLEGLRAEMDLDLDAAIQAYEQGYERSPNNADCTFRLARLLDLKGHDDEAVELYEGLIKHGPANVSTLANLGVLYEDLAAWRKAEACYRAILDIDPTDTRAQLYLDNVEASKHMHYDEDLEKREDKRNAILRTPVTDFELSVRSRNCLAKMGIRTLGDLVRKTEAELLSYKNFGETSLLEIQEILESKGLRLGMDPDELMSDNLGEPREAANLDLSDPRNRPISELDLSVRSRRVIEMFKLRTVGDLTQKTEAELMACPNFGQTSLNEIKSKLDSYGLSLKG